VHQVGFYLHDNNIHLVHIRDMFRPIISAIRRYYNKNWGRVLYFCTKKICRYERCIAILV